MYSKFPIYILYLLVGIILGTIIRSKVISRGDVPSDNVRKANRTSKLYDKQFFITYPGKNAPNILVSPKQYNFGKKFEGTTVYHTFLIRNVGNSPLKIKKIHPSCGCTIATPSKSLISPGGHALLQTTVNLTNESGYQRKIITVRTNDPETPITHLIIQGKVTSRIKVIPKQITLNYKQSGHVLVKTVKVQTKGDLSIIVKQIKTSSKNIIADYDVLKPEEKYRVYIKIKNLKNHKQDKEWVRLITNKTGNYHTITIPIKVQNEN